MPGLCVHHLIEEQASQTPDAAAVYAGDDVVTYRELGQRAERIAARLTEYGAGPERLVAVAMEPSPRWLATLLAVWKAGGVYLPVDPALPRPAAAAMLAEAGVELVVADGAAAVGPPGARVLDVAGLDLPAGLPSAEAAPTEVGPANLAYCVFTSGSTGRPKPVAVAHASIANHAAAIGAELGLHARDRVLQFTPMAIDAALEEILPAWLAGAAVVLPDHRRPTSQELTRLVTRHAVSVLSLPSAYWHQWVDDLSAGLTTIPDCVRTVFVGGDKIRADKLAVWAALPGARAIDWIADYGPTEATISVTLHRPGNTETPESGLVPIGRPIVNSSVYVLDEDLSPVPDGIPGDLWIGGAPLARGYLGAPAVTADRFLPDPFGRPGARMYRTGDRGRRRPDGTLVFLGRSDRQVKIRGHRVEPGQVESAVLGCAGVRDAVVIARDDELSGARLVGYVEAEAGLSEAALRADLAGRLPEVMVPQTLVLLERLPRSELNGKVAIARLPPPTPARAPAERAGGEGRTTLEHVVAAIAADVLGWPLGRDENFFDAGGDSLRALQLLSRIAQVSGAALTFAQLRSAPRVREIAALIEAEQGGGAADRMVTPTDDRRQRRPASRGQQALWFLNRLHQGAPTYAVPLGYWIAGPLDLDRLDAALTAVVARHQALRTVFEERDGRVWQRVLDAGPVRTDVTVVADRSEAARRAEEAAGRPFDLSAGPLLRSQCFQVDDRQHLLLLNVHHAVFDAWSLAVFWRELAALYAGRTLPQPDLQFADYVSWQERWLTGAEAQEQRRYWRRQLDGRAPVVVPGASRDHAGQAGFALALPSAAISPAVVEDVARDCGTTAFTVLLAAFFASLRRTAGGVDEAVVGVPVAGRTRPGSEDLIGYLVNTVAVRVRFDDQMSFRELVRRTDETMAQALTRQELPFADVVDGLARADGAEENPLFQAMFVLQSTPLDGGGHIAGLAISEQLVHSGTAKVALTCTLRQDEAGLSGEVEYAASRFDRDSARRWQEALVTLLAAGLADPDALIDELPLLPARQAAELVAATNAPDPAASPAALLHGGFARMAAGQPDATAVEADGVSLSYAELDARAEALATDLAAAGVGPESLVGVCVPRSPALIVALLAVLKAGAGFVPLDPAFPAERLRRIVRDSAMAAVVATAPVTPGLEGVPAFDPAAARGRGQRPPVPVMPQHLALVHYTSGSTGAPKGVAIEHGCAALRVDWIARRYALAPGLRVVHKTPLIFDVSVWEIFATLGAGATVLLAEAGAETDVPQLSALLGRAGTVLAHFVPSMLDLYLATVDDRSYPDLRWVQLSGEAVPTALLERFAAHFEADLHNMYGQTETSEVAAWEGRAVPPGSPVPLGRAINGYRLFILDQALQPLPPGLTGELYIARTDGLARGYHGQAALTAERFLPNPFAVRPGERIYRTGDLARLGEDGVLYHEGRADGQAKVRGVRVEPGEIEAALAAHPAVDQAVVVVRDDEAGRKEIVAYVTGDRVEIPDLAEHAARQLSQYLLPAVYVRLTSIPLTLSGKIDRAALRAPTSEDRQARSGGEDATSLIEGQLAELWRDLLRLDRIGRKDNFFAVGGSSLSALQMLHRIKTRFKVSVTVREFFSAPTIAGMATCVEKALMASLENLSDEEVAQRLSDQEVS